MPGQGHYDPLLVLANSEVSVRTLRPLWPKRVQAPSAWIRDGPGLNHLQSLMASNFTVL